MWNRIRTLIIKELRILLRDKKTRIIIMVPPIMQLFLFTFACTLEVKNISLGILNYDSGYESRELIRRFEYSPYFKKITFLKNLEERQDFLDSQKGIITLTIPNDFSRCIGNGDQTKIQLLTDGRKSSSSQIASGYASSIISTYLQPENAIQAEPMRVRNWFNPNLDYRYFTLPSLVGILCMIMGIMIPALSIAREREFNTYDQILVSPLSTLELLIGKTVPSLIIGLFQATLMTCAAVFIFRIPFTGNLFLFYLSIIIFMISVIGIGLFISSLCRTQQQAILGVFVVCVPAVLLSGYATPVENMPQCFQYLSTVDPLRFFLVISRGVFLKSMTFSNIMENLIPIIGIAFFTLGFAGWFFKKKLD